MILLFQLAFDLDHYDATTALFPRLSPSIHSRFSQSPSHPHCFPPQTVTTESDEWLAMVDAQLIG